MLAYIFRFKAMHRERKGEVAVTTNCTARCLLAKTPGMAAALNILLSCQAGTVTQG
jgi:hypothetical protein